MNIENDIFKRTTVNYKRLEEYGFKKSNNDYIYEKKFLDNDFKAIITINNKGSIQGKVIDLLVDEEYLGLRAEMNGEFINKVRDAYKDILIDIKNNCFETKNYIYDQTNRIDKSKLDNDSGEVEIINVKLNSEKIKDLLKQKGFYKAYHMNKTEWISIILNDTLSDKEIIDLIDESYNIINESEEWLIPANPKYYDIVNCFNDTDEIIWKQSSNIHINDIIYLYVAEPYSKIMYKCKAIEVDIPYDYKDKNVSMKYVMKIKLLKRLDNNNYSFKYLNDLGIKAIRGPRKISKDISDKLK